MYQVKLSSATKHVLRSRKISTRTFIKKMEEVMLDFKEFKFEEVNIKRNFYNYVIIKKNRVSVSNKKGIKYTLSYQFKYDENKNDIYITSIDIIGLY